MKYDMDRILMSKTPCLMVTAYKRTPLYFLLILLCIFFAFCKTPDASSGKPYELSKKLLIDGSIYYNQASCANCHGLAYDGKGPAAEKLKEERGLNVPNLRQTIAAKRIPEDYFKSITIGTEKFPEHRYNAYTDRGRWALAHYLYTLAPVPIKSSDKIVRNKALRAMYKRLSEIYSKSRRWNLSKNHTEQQKNTRSTPPALEDLL